MSEVSRETPPAIAAEVFQDRLPLAQGYAHLLATDATTRGLIGPREHDRLWERHLMNCAVVAERLPAHARIADVGSGAGLPGVVWAIARADVTVTVIEPLLRRTEFLQEAVDKLGLSNQVTVWRGRAEEHRASYPIVAARAVAAMDKLAAWCLPLVLPGGVLLALKGQSAARELEKSSSTLRRLGATSYAVATYGEGMLAPPTTVIEVVTSGHQVVQGLGYPRDIGERVAPGSQVSTPLGWMPPPVSRETKTRTEEL